MGTYDEMRADEWEEAREEAERRVSDPEDYLTYDMEADAFVAGAAWARRRLAQAPAVSNPDNT